MKVGPIKNLLSNPSNVLYICAGYYVLMVFITPGFFTIHNSWNLLYTFLPLAIIAIGQTFVMLTGGIDLSVTATIAIASVAGGFLMSSDTGLADGPMAIAIGIPGMLLCGVSIGWFNGLVVARLKMPPFMVTLTSLIFFSGFAVWMTHSKSIYHLTEGFVNFPYASWLGIPIPLLVGAIVLLLAYVLLHKTLLGEWIFATGVNKKTAYLSGVNVALTITSVYMISGICASIGSMFYTARLETGSPVMGQNMLLDIIGAVVIGGTSLFGGKGKIRWTLVGALFMTMLDNSLNLLGLSFFLIMVVKGGIILATAVLNVMQAKKSTSYA